MRLSITRRSDLAIRALRTLSVHPEWVGSDTLATSIGTTRGFLFQVMAPLVRARWVRSTPGPSGGYRLGSSVGDITVLAVIETVEGPIDEAVCVLERERACSSTRSTEHPACALHESWLDARSALRSELARRPVITTEGLSPDSWRPEKDVHD